MTSPQQALCNMLSRNLRKILPENYSFSLVLWQRLSEEKVEVSSVSHGDPEEIRVILRDISDEAGPDEERATA